VAVVAGWPNYFGGESSMLAPFAMPGMVNSTRADSRLVVVALEAVSVASYDPARLVERSGPVPISTHTHTFSIAIGSFHIAARNRCFGTGVKVPGSTLHVTSSPNTSSIGFKRG
jgi:hypothetical protein